MKKIIHLFLLLLCPVHLLWGQYGFGVPDIKNYSRQVYHAGSQNWDIAQDEKGIMYFGNNDGLLSFDGYRWRLYHLPEDKNVRSLSIEGDRIYIGGQEEIGFFSPGRNGELAYTSLKAAIPAPARHDFADIWNVVVAGKCVFFRSNRNVFVLENGKIRAFSSFNWSFLGKVGREVYAYDDARGLLQYTAGSWKRVVPRQVFPPGVQISNMLSIGHAIWFVTLTDGVFRWEKGKVEPFRTPQIEKLKGGYLYRAIPISANRIACITNLDGCEVLDTLGNLVSTISRKEGLQSNNIISGYLDKDRNLWLGLGNGIDMVAINKPVYSIYPDGENPISGYTSAVYRNNLFLGTASGVYKVPYLPGKGILPDFRLLPAASGQIWGLDTIGNRLLIGQYKRALVYDQGALKEINDLPTGFWNFNKIPHSNWLVAGTYNGVHYFRSMADGIKDADLEALFESAKYVVVDGHTIWAMHPYKGLYKISLTSEYLPGEKIHITQAPFLSANHNHLFRVGERIVITSDRGIFEWNESRDRFLPSPYFNRIFGKKNLDFIVQATNGNYWFVENGRLGIAKKIQSDKYALLYFSELDSRLQFNENQHIGLLNDSCAIVAAERGFFYVDASRYERDALRNTLLIRSFMIQTPTKDSLVYGGYENGTSAVPRLPFRYNSVNITFGVPHYGYGHVLQYSYRLEGQDTGWSTWSSRYEKIYTNLEPGSYLFHVRARSGSSGSEVKSAVFAFEVLAPWYRNWIAYTGYAVLGLLAVAFGLKYLYDRYDRQQARKLVAHRAEFEKKRKEMQWQYQLEKEQNEKQLAQLHSEKLEMELEMKNATIAANAMMIIQKGELLNKVKKELTEIISEKEPTNPTQLKKVVKIVDQEINNKEDWEQFAVHFNKVHENFLKKIKEAHPALSQGDLKLCALLKLGMTSKDISGVLNISLKAVEISRYRLRKKLNLQTTDNLFDFLSTFS